MRARDLHKLAKLLFVEARSQRSFIIQAISPTVTNALVGRDLTILR